MSQITSEDYFGKMSRLNGEMPSEIVRANADELLRRGNAILAAVADRVDDDCVLAPRLNSGWRSASYNQVTQGAAVYSRHITGEAFDVRDPEGIIDSVLFEDWQKCKAEGREEYCLLAKYGLYMEHPLATKGWCHLQTVPPRSGNRVFFP